MFVSIIITCFKARIKILNCPMAATAFVVPFAFFFQYNNLEVFMVNGVIYLHGLLLVLLSHNIKDGEINNQKMF